MITLLIKILRAVRIIPRTSSPRESILRPFDVRNDGAGRQQSRMITSSEDFFRQAKEVALSPGERMATKTGLLEKMRGPQKSAPFLSRFFGFYKMTYAAGAFLIAGLAFSGLSYTAEGALPGDFLYPVKINVNERVRDSLATTHPEAAAWQAEKAERRLTEAEKLASVSPLNATVNRALSREFKKNIKNMESNINSMLAGKDLAFAHDLNVAFQTSLKAHAALLTGLDGKKSVAAASAQAADTTLYDYENAGSGTDGLLASVNDAVVRAEETHTAMELTAPDLYSSSAQKTELEQVLKQTEIAVSLLKSNLMKDKKSLSPKLFSFVEHELSCADLALLKAKTATGSERALRLAYAGMSDAKEAELALTNHDIVFEKTDVSNDVSAEIENERHEGTMLSALVHLRMTNERLAAVTLALTNTQPSTPILQISSDLEQINKLVDAANQDLKDGNCDNALKVSRVALADAEVLRTQSEKLPKQ